MIAKSNFHSRSVFSENLAIEMRKLEMKFDKPMYVDMCILNISKTYLYEVFIFTTSTCYRSFMKNIKLCIPIWIALFITALFIECDDIAVMKCEINRFDTNDYAIDNAYDISR